MNRHPGEGRERLEMDEIKQKYTRLPLLQKIRVLKYDIKTTEFKLAEIDFIYVRFIFE